MGVTSTPMPLEVMHLDVIIECECVGKEARGLRTEPQRSPPLRGRSAEEGEPALMV